MPVKRVFPKIIHEGMSNRKCYACYVEPLNVVFINVSPFSFKHEYELYGFSGLKRDLSMRVIHELCHWATDSMKGHDVRKVTSNLFRSRILLEIDLWTLKIHSILYDLQRKNPHNIYFEV